MASSGIPAYRLSWLTWLAAGGKGLSQATTEMSLITASAER